MRCLVLADLWLPPPLSPCCFNVMQAAPAYAKLRVERMNQRMAGIRAKRAKEAEAAEKDN